MLTFRDLVYSGGEPLSPAPLFEGTQEIHGRIVLPLAHRELAIGQRIEDLLARSPDITSRSISRDAACVYFRNGVVTFDYRIDDQGNPAPRGIHHRRITLGPDDNAIFMDYDMMEDCVRNVTVKPHLPLNDDEQTLEDILVEIRDFAIEVEKRMG